ncbi:MAG TPA: M24 family metallopeptidase [Syntrophorhabdales bacterium]|nr:M24 family metallopeptidase [Syntrophorhabdales bacterium]
METMRPTLKRGRDVWDRINMPKTEFLERVGKIRARMGEQGMNVLLLHANSTDEYGDPCYISNYVMKMPQGAMVVIPLAGEVALICEGFARDLPGVKGITWVENVISCDNVSARSIAFLKENGLIPSTIGISGLEQSMPHDQYRFFLDSTGSCNVIRANRMIREMRMIKSQREVDQVRRSARIVTRAFEKICQTTFSQISEKNIEAVMGREAYFEGAEDVRILIARPGEANSALRPLEGLPVSAHEPVMLCLAVEFERYWAQGIKTFLFEKDTFVESDRNFLRPLFNRIIESLAAGREISRFRGETLAQAGSLQIDVLPEYGLGQGIGLSLQEAPFLDESETGRFQEGMCLALQIAARHEEAGFAVMGETVYLSGNGPEVLTRV